LSANVKENWQGKIKSTIKTMMLIQCRK